MWKTVTKDSRQPHTLRPTFEANANDWVDHRRECSKQTSQTRLHMTLLHIVVLCMCTGSRGCLNCHAKCTLGTVYIMPTHMLALSVAQLKLVLSISSKLHVSDYMQNLLVLV